MRGRAEKGKSGEAGAGRATSTAPAGLVESGGRQVRSMRPE